MCGIAGGIGSGNVDIPQVLSIMAHRGPDSNGSFAEDDIFLGHTRLSIQDLSDNGRQPMFSNDNRYVIVFNGEIYNHHEIRSEFKDEFKFRSSGDTETVLNAYIKYGPSFLNKLNGIFALAIYDRQLKELFLARDQMGVKPLYIYQDTSLFLFSSEIKTFLAFDIDKELEPNAFVNYLSLLWSPGELTPFRKVRKLLPGHYLQLRVDSTQLSQANPVKYFSLNFNGQYSQLSEEKLIDELEEKLLSAVKRQMLSDVPVGFFLSGGLDSSLIVAMAKRLFPDNQFPCFSIDIDAWSAGTENFENDIFFAKKVAEYLGVELHVVKADIDIVKSFDKMVWHLDEPQADAAPINVLNIASLARQKGIKVLLGGAGGDDVFSGYRRHQALRYEKLFRLIPGSVAKFGKRLLSVVPLRGALLRRARKIINELGKSTEGRMSGYFGWLQDDVVHDLFTDEWKKKINNYSPLAYLVGLNKDIPGENSLLNRMLYWEMRSFLVDHNLNYTDKMAMAVGVEARVPYLDLELVEFSLKIPPHLKMHGKETKYILKKVAERYLPKEIIYRSKTGFGAPIRNWILKDMDGIINERLSTDRLSAQGIFNNIKVRELIDANKKGVVDASYSIWSILAIESWLTQFGDDKTKI